MLKIVNGGKLPEKATKYSAAVDLYASEDVVIGAGETKTVGLGVCVDEDFFIHGLTTVKVGTDGKIENEGYDNSTYVFLKTHYLELHPRSSLRAKGLIAGVGVIDLDYKDEIKIVIHNPIKSIELLDRDILFAQGYGSSTLTGFENDEFEIKKGDKIAQILLKEHKTYLLGIESDKERLGGFGSTDR